MHVRLSLTVDNAVHVHIGSGGHPGFQTVGAVEAAFKDTLGFVAAKAVLAPVCCSREPLAGF
jgi:hypothetical protein